MKQLAFLTVTLLILSSCSKQDDEIIHDASHDAHTIQLSLAQDIANDLALYMDEQISDYAAAHPGNVLPDNANNPLDNVGQDHNALISEIYENRNAELTSTASFTTSDCFPATCSNVTLGSEHRASYLALDEYDSQFGNQSVYDMLDRQMFADHIDGYVDFLNDNWNGTNDGSFSVTEYEVYFSDIGLPEQIQLCMAVIMNRMATIQDADIFTQVAKDVEDYIVLETDLGTDQQNGILAFVSTLKHSHSYWSDQPMPTIGPYGTALSIPPFWKKVLTAAAVDGIYGGVGYIQARQNYGLSHEHSLVGGIIFGVIGTGGYIAGL